MLFEAATGTPPFPDGLETSLNGDRAPSVSPSVRSHRRLPAQLARAIDSCLDPEPGGQAQVMAVSMSRARLAMRAAFAGSAAGSTQASERIRGRDQGANRHGRHRHCRWLARRFAASRMAAWRHSRATAIRGLRGDRPAIPRQPGPLRRLDRARPPRRGRRPGCARQGLSIVAEVRSGSEPSAMAVPIVRNTALNDLRDERVHEHLDENWDGVRQPPEVAAQRAELAALVARIHEPPRSAARGPGQAGAGGQEPRGDR